MKKLFLAGLGMVLSINAAANDLVWGDIRFDIMSTRMASNNTLRIMISGLENGTQTESAKVDGVIVSQQVADLNGDNAPELYIVTRSDGSGSYGNIIAYSSNNNKSASQIYLPELKFKGYMGHDRFEVKEDRIERTFPVYNDGDANCCPAGGEHTIVYKLVAGEAGWILQMQE
jgi:hypothetical protein